MRWAYSIITAGDPTDLLPLEAAKKHLDVTFADDDELIGDYIKSALDWVQEHTGLFLSNTIVEVYSDGLATPYELPFGPFIAVTSMTVGGEAVVPRQVGQSGLLLPPAGSSWPYVAVSELGAVTTRYSVGFQSAVVPPVLIQAAKIVLSIFYDKPEGNELENQWKAVRNMLSTSRVRNL